MTEIKFLNLIQILSINKRIENIAKEDKEIKYIRRFVSIKYRKNLDTLVNCANKYYFKTNDIQLTAAYYLKNIIILQSLEDANHRTAIIATRIFLQSNGCNLKEHVEDDCFLVFKNDLLIYRNIEYYTYKPLMTNDALKFDENTTENTTENLVFKYCLKFIKNKILK